MRLVRYFSLEARSAGYYAGLAGAGLIALFGAFAAWHMEHEGHHITGMSNQVIWGLPHVAAIFLILVASGVLNIGTISTVFGKTHYKPLVRLSALVAVATLVGGLAVLVLDLGRPDRLIVAMTYYNFKSIFAWNIFLYTGFLLIAVVYLWTLFERRMARFTPAIGVVSLVWRIVLTTGTGAIFGFMVARTAYDTAIMAPQFIVLSLGVGLAAYMLVLAALGRCAAMPLGEYIFFRLRNLLGVFVLTLLYITVTSLLAKLYSAAHEDSAMFFLRDGGVYTCVFWLGYVAAGSVAPVVLFYIKPFSRSSVAATLGAALALVGGVSLLYMYIIGGQALPLVMFPGFVESSSFFDGVVNDYAPSAPEVLLGLGGVGLAVAILIFMLAALDFIPEDLSDGYFGEGAPGEAPPDAAANDKAQSKA